MVTLVKSLEKSHIETLLKVAELSAIFATLINRKEYWSYER
jgi:hypothetical protein